MVNGFAGTFLYDIAQIHDRNPIRDVFYDGEIVSDKQVSKIEFFLQIHEQVQDLALDRNVQCRYWFIANHQSWIECNRSRDADSLSLATGKFKWISGDGSCWQAHDIQQFSDAFCATGFIANFLNYVRFFQNIANRMAWVQ